MPLFHVTGGLMFGSQNSNTICQSSFCFNILTVTKILKCFAGNFSKYLYTCIKKSYSLIQLQNKAIVGMRLHCWCCPLVTHIENTSHCTVVSLALYENTPSPTKLKVRNMMQCCQRRFKPRQHGRRQHAPEIW